jgi:SARP family transcriptional regulator, regulator of embCAB operon
MARTTTPSLARPRIDALGALEVHMDDRVLDGRHLGGVKPKQVLEILLLSRGRPVPKERLADMIWPEQLPRQVVSTLESYVSVLRTKLGPELGRRNGLIITDHEAYRLDPTVVDIDLDLFDDLVKLAAGAEAEERLAILRSASELIRGELLDDEPYADWVAQARTVYCGRSLAVLIELSWDLLQRGQVPEAIAYAERAMEIDPLDERVLQLSMLCYHSAQRTHQAVLTYRRTEQLLATTCELPLADESRQLFDRIRKRTPISELLSTA